MHVVVVRGTGGGRLLLTCDEKFQRYSPKPIHANKTATGQALLPCRPTGLGEGEGDVWKPSPSPASARRSLEDERGFRALSNKLMMTSLSIIHLRARVCVLMYGRICACVCVSVLMFGRV